MGAPWYPGHSARAKREIKENIKVVDVVVEVLDARIPYSSRNRGLPNLILRKPLIVALSRIDLADPSMTRRWLDYFKHNGEVACGFNGSDGTGVERVVAAVKRAGGPTRRQRPVRVMIVGIPNVGKSSLINRIVGGRKARVGRTPGITRGKQWILLEDMELMDTPGTLAPDASGRRSNMLLAACGCLPETSFDPVGTSVFLIDELLAMGYDGFAARDIPFHLNPINPNASTPGTKPMEILTEIGKAKGCLGPEGTIDHHRAATALLKDFQNGKLGRFTLETPGSKANATEGSGTDE